MKVLVLASNQLADELGLGKGEKVHIGATIFRGYTILLFLSFEE